MKDEVKITVIATGFKQDMPDRRARMISEATTMSDYQVPIRGRVAKAESGALFASEEREMKATQLAAPRAKKEVMPAEEEANEGKLHAGRIWISPEEMDDVAGAMGETAAECSDELTIHETVSPIVSEREPELVPVAASVFDDDFFRTSGHTRATEDANSVSNASGVTREQRGVVQAEHAEADELDIPAFLRRSH